MEHHDYFPSILLELTVLITVVMLGRSLAKRFQQPSVLGELLAGVALGNIGYWLGFPLSTLVMNLSGAGKVFDAVFTKGISIAEATKSISSLGSAGPELAELMTGPRATEVLLMAVTLWIFSNIGVVLLMFMVGLDSSVDEMKQVGKPATFVALLGIILPFGLGYWACTALLPDGTIYQRLFLATTLCATSVGITAAALKELGKLRTSEGRIVMGAAVIDDVLAMLILAVVVGITVHGDINAIEIGRIMGMAALFIGTLLLFGDRIARATSGIYRFFDQAGLKLFFPLGLAFALAWLASAVGLAAIVGAFAAGLIINERYLNNDDSITTRQTLAPIESVVSPVFFLLMGMQVDISAFLDPNTAFIGLALTAIAIVSKLASGWVAGRGLDHLTIGIGMVPRGEVALIFVGMGKTIGVIDDALFSATIFMVIATAFIAPIGLKWSIGRRTAVP